ncbi:MAG: ABC transporter ATP-binding protein [Candidatus Hermodarchaeota archaeon]
MTNLTPSLQKNMKQNNKMPLLEIKDLVVDYPTSEGNVRAVDQVSLSLYPGESLGLVGESGCGKSTLGFAILRLLKGGVIRTGSIMFNGKDLAQLTEDQMREIRGAKISMVFQASQNALNPLQKVSQHFIKTLRVHEKWSEDEWNAVLELLHRLEIPESRVNDYPFQFSGGMQQRMVIALSLLLQPKLIIADEPTTALDVLVQARILQLLKDLKEEFDLTMMLITHDLGVVAEITQRVAIMYAGQILEVGDTTMIFQKPNHPYTRGLIKAIPNVKDESQKQLAFIPGHPPDLKNLPRGCRFADRCSFTIEICREQMPQLLKYSSENGSENLVRCYMYDDRYANQF